MRLAVVLGVTLSLAVPGAGAAIVPQRGIAGVNLSMSKAGVRATLGRPRAVRHGTNTFGPWTEFFYLDLRISFQSGSKVTEISTTSPRQRTARGIGVGSTERQVKHRVSGVRCRTDLGRRHCFVGRFLPGRRVTDFTVARGQVSRVTVAYVLD